ncbi:MAG: lysine--tRNA ligase, partial [Ardenticatenales bacterium]|nr:lysine--tRNA ligase [Ardenticatenales bacterium]
MEPEQFNEYQRVRYEKMMALREQGIDPYPPRVDRTHSSQEAIAALHDTPEGTEPARVTIVGRVMAIRIMGKAAFAHLEDGVGRIQLYLRRDGMGEEGYNQFKKLVDLGDFIQATGTMFYTRTQEPTVEAESWTMLAKALNQPPEKWHGLSDIEQRYRERYTDLMSNSEIRDIFIMRARITSLVRRFLEDRGFLEMETPILQPLYGGAAARPFVTHHHWAKRDLYLRIADELYLKRLLVGGLERVFEIGKDFRNEGVSFKHNPEFTMMEVYQAYADYRDMMELAEGCWSFVCQAVHGTTQIPFGEHIIDLAPPWPRISLRDAILERTGVDLYEAETLETLQAAIQAKGLRLERKPTWGKQVDELFSASVEPHLIQPTFIVDYPYDLSPLAKQKADNPRLVERFELFIAGMEFANAFTELNDPLEQIRRFQGQESQASAGDDETQPMDEDFINALMYGMPPTGGMGWGMDRMIMVLTNQHSIREVILFPQLRQGQE